ncbi:helix-turn-helix domain-containing protein [Rhizobacter sp. J219]|uniref:GlxA family transcriptional regulator n=1 Tax=Rhizobacter sp. J219 TaxID=2898430 RepID=UPI002150ECE4|nr:helix-turn-helix domain-containing protein [Rhizobacter sp. J219]MCR5883827.1 helix-turn-helix domain-containing protein [Rhizobacter sp. J219]
MTSVKKQAQRSASKPNHIAFALLPDFLDASLGVTLTIAQTVNALCRAAGRPDAIHVSMVAPERSACPSAAGLRVAHEPLAVARAADWLIFPGAFIENADAMKAWVDQPAVAPWLQIVRERQKDSLPTAASCAGTWLLAQAGVLDTRHATTVWWLGAAFRERYPSVRLEVDRMVVSDGPIVTAGAAFAHLDLMLYLIARVVDASLAERCARLLVADRREAQSRYVSLAWMAESDPLMRQACRWIDKHLDQTVNVEDLAQALNLTPRTLARRCTQALGVSPWRLVQRRRVEAAVDLLRTTTLPFETVAGRVGYGDTSALRALIRREFGMSPSEAPAVSASSASCDAVVSFSDPEVRRWSELR